MSGTTSFEGSALLTPPTPAPIDQGQCELVRRDGNAVGSIVGCDVGSGLGDPVGSSVGSRVGSDVGTLVGKDVGNPEKYSEA